MKHKFTRQDLPIAFSMLDAADRIRPRRDGRHPYDKFFLMWTAFTQIYAAIASNAGLSTQYQYNDDGTIATQMNGNVKIPRVTPVNVSDQLRAAFGELDKELKHTLIMHPGVQFFLQRKPFWQGKPIGIDAFGQRVNGVIKVRETTRAEYPVWSPVDPQVHAAYLKNPNDETSRDFLAQQILELLHTISTNLMHFNKSFDDSTDISVVENALPLLGLIV